MLGKRLKAAGEGDDRGWDGWMASQTQWTWVWVNSGNCNGQRGLVCCSPWGCKESDTTEQLNWMDMVVYCCSFNLHFVDNLRWQGRLNFIKHFPCLKWQSFLPSRYKWTNMCLYISSNTHTHTHTYQMAYRNLAPWCFLVSILFFKLKCSLVHWFFCNR